MNNKQKEYILNHFNEYHITNEKGQPITRADMLALLNILESQGETLESFHDVAFNGDMEFCGIYGEYNTDSDTYNALTDHHLFLSDAEFIDYMLEQIQDYTADGSTDVAEFFKLSDSNIYKTTDGYVIRFDY